MHPHLESVPESEKDWFDALARLARFLRSPDGCPWDQKQTAANFAAYAREECDELNEAVASGVGADIEEEFGDVFFVLLAAAAAAEHEGLFTLQGALARAHEKMIRRHEHVFGGSKAATPEDAVESWNEIKRREKSQRGEN